MGAPVAWASSHVPIGTMPMPHQKTNWQMLRLLCHVPRIMFPSRMGATKLPLRQIIFSALACLILGCGPAGKHGVIEQTIEQVYPLTPGGTVSIRNVDGSIHIYGSSMAEVRL